MLAGMQLDVFTPLKDGPLTAEQLAAALNVKAEKLSPLLYALVAAELLTVEGTRTFCLVLKHAIQRRILAVE